MPEVMRLRQACDGSAEEWCKNTTGYCDYGVDDQPLASYLQIPLTTIWQPVQDEGRCAAKEMVRQLKVNQKE